MPAAQPKSKPQASALDILKIVEANNIDRKKSPLVLVGIRGYYMDSMGVKGANDRKMYDDALFVVTLDEVVAYNFNVDPNGARKGKGTGSQKGMASLACGVWDYTAGIHKGYQAFRQAGPVTVIRDGNPPYPHTGWHGINLHRGGVNGTSSLGCCTWPTQQFDDAKKFIYEKLHQYSGKKFPFAPFKYILIDESERRKGNLKVA